MTEEDRKISSKTETLILLISRGCCSLESFSDFLNGFGYKNGFLKIKSLYDIKKIHKDSSFLIKDKEIKKI